MRNSLQQGLLLFLLMAGPLSAQPSAPSSPWLPGPPELVAANLGAFEVMDGVSAYEMGWEVRFAPRRFHFLPRRVPDLIPVTGVMASSRGVIYPYVGFRVDIPLNSHWTFSPGSAAGLYYREHGKNLGGFLEFRSHAELTYRLPWDGRIGLCFYHLSNGGLFDFNPGTESLVLTYTARLRH
jgi:lipid A 3-O-deacylase